jgi:hypothetical protein
MAAQTDSQFILCSGKSSNVTAVPKSLRLVNAYALFAAGHVFKLDLTGNESVESVISTDANAVSGMDLCASLSYDDVTGEYGLSVCLLHTETLGFGISAVLCGTDTLFMGEKLQT